MTNRLLKSQFFTTGSHTVTSLRRRPSQERFCRRFITGIISGSFFQHFRENSFGGKLLKSQNSVQFLAKTPKILFKTQFSGKSREFLLHKSFENTTHRVNTQPNYKTQVQNFPKTQFFGNSCCLSCRTMVE